MPIKIAQIALVITLALAGAGSASADPSNNFAAKFFAERALNGN